MADLNEKQKAILAAAAAKKKGSSGSTSSGKANREVYREDWLKDYTDKTGKNTLDLIAGYIKDQSLPTDVAGVQSSKVPGSYGQADWWGDPKLKADFQKRHKWYLDDYKKRTGNDWSPNLDQFKDQKTGQLKSKAVEDFQNKFNERAAKYGLKPYFDKSAGFDTDAMWGQHTYSAPDFNEPPTSKPGPKSKTETPVIDKGPLPVEDPGYIQQNPNAPWWLQDVVNTAASFGNRASLKKYLPWAPQVHLQTPRPTFYDPTRELANNTEQMAIGTEGAGMFAGPQAFNSRFSGIQGQGAKNAANILSQYHNKNVGVANQFENLRTDILNKNTMLNADTAHKLYDQTTVANQQFDNAKRQANNEIRESYVNALTNRAQTQTMNALYPHYQIDPMRGGFLNFTKGNTPRPSASETLSQQIADAKRIAAENDLDFKDVLDYMGKGRSQDRRRDSMPEYDDPSNLSADELERQDWLRQRGITNIGPYGGYTK